MFCYAQYFCELIYTSYTLNIICACVHAYMRYVCAVDLSDAKSVPYTYTHAHGTRVQHSNPAKSARPAVRYAPEICAPHQRCEERGWRCWVGLEDTSTAQKSLKKSCTYNEHVTHNEGIRDADADELALCRAHTRTHVLICDTRSAMCVCMLGLLCRDNIHIDTLALVPHIL